MISFYKTIKEVVGERLRSFFLPVALSCVDSILHMSMFCIMLATILGLLNQTFTSGKLLTYSIVLLLLFVVRAVLYSLNYTRTQFRGADVTAHLRLSLGDHIRSLNLGYFNKNSIGRLTSTLTTDIADFEQILTHSMSSIFKVLFFSAFTLLFAFFISWQYGLVLLALILLAFPLMYVSGNMSRKYGAKQRNSVNGVISRIVEYINGIKTFKLYNLTGERFERLDNSFEELKKQSIRLELSIMPFSILFSIVTSFMLPVALIVGTWMLQGGNLDTQEFVLSIMIAVSLSSMMATLGSLYPEMTYLGKAAENILQVRKEKPLAYQKDADTLSSHAISFHNVHFSYEDGVEVLHGISFHADPGTTTALVGPSGSGKTTVISLISRFWDVTSGSITIGEEDIQDLSPDGLASHIAVVFQEVYLLNDTVANNIRVGRPNATQEQIEAAAKAARCHDFIMQLPDGYDTLVGEGGSTLSGGEKQRISIARALIKDAPIVLLDETTSNLDADNEQEINKALDKLMEGKTVIVIAHRLNTIINADQILVLQEGKIKEHGTHQELIKHGGWYSHVISEQEKSKEWKV